MVNLNHGAAIVGIHEHQTRYAPDKSELQIQGESVIKALKMQVLAKMTSKDFLPLLAPLGTADWI